MYVHSGGHNWAPELLEPEFQAVVICHVGVLGEK